MNIVQVLGRGELSPMPYYFIDMELCNFNLDTYFRYLRNVRNGNNDSKYSLEMENMKPPLEILKDITSGVFFIHEQEEVHRDLKPQNG